MLIGYLVSQYPAASHTFIRREVEELRARGFALQTFSVRRPAPGECIAPRDRAAFEETFYILPAGPAALGLAHLRAAARRPGRYFGTLAASLGHRPPGLRALAWALFHFAEAILLAGELERRGIGHLHNHFANAGATVGFLAARYLGLPWSLTLHGVSETDYPAGLLLGRKIEAARFVACVSHFGRAQALRIAPPAHWHKLRIVRCGLRLSDLPARRRAGAVPRVICVGRLSAEKGQLGLLEAFAALRDRGIEAELVLVGDGPERARIEERLAALRLENRVALRGRLDEDATLREIAAADLLVLPSFMEGLPIVLMEAMALGVPVVATRVAGIPELVAEEREGLLFTPADWSDLAGKMARILTDPSLGARLAAAARAKIEGEFAIGRAVEPLARLFQGLEGVGGDRSGSAAGGDPGPVPGPEGARGRA